MTRASPALCTLLLLAGCGPLVQIGDTAPPPPSLLTLSATSPAAVPAGQAAVDLRQAVTIAIPSVPGSLQTLRVPVTVSDTAVQYVPVARWSEPPNRLFQRLLADTLVHRGVAVIDLATTGTMAGRQLTGQLQAFGIDTRGGAPFARVRYDATLSSPEGVRQRRFERDVAMAGVSGTEAGPALNAAANAVAADVAIWVAGISGAGGS